MLFKICPNPIALFFGSFKTFGKKSSGWGSCESGNNCLKGETLNLPGIEVNY